MYFQAVVLAALASGQANVAGSLEASQLAANSFVFIIAAPGNCLAALSDLPRSVSKNMAALWIRAAFHDAGTWDPTDRSGGADSSLLSFLDDPENAGLSDSVAPKFMQNPRVNMTRSDMIALAGQISVSHCGGPNMTFEAGRQDARIPVSPRGRIPPGDAKLADFKARFRLMGWTNEDIVALVTGSHTMGGIHGKNTPSLTNEPFVPFDDTPGIFDNNVFQQTLKGRCPVPMDCEIANDPELRPIVMKYASDQKAFFDQYAVSFKKLTGQTRSKLGSPQNIFVPLHTALFSSINQLPGSNTSNVTGSAKSSSLPVTVSLSTFILMFYLFL
jgi:L-ascorbate peroxidase